VKTLGCPAPIFPYDPPALLTVPLAFVTAWSVSVWQTRGSRYALASAT
jgi:cation/acetate symporter